MERSKVAFLARCAGLARVSEAALERLAACAAARDVDRRAVLWRAGDRASALGWVRSGVLREASDGVTFGFLGRGELLGETGAVAALDQPDAVYGTTVTAHEASVVYAVPVEDLAGLVAEPSIAAGLAGALAARARRAEERLVRAHRDPAEARVAAALLDLARDFGVRDDRGVIVDLKLTHREIASLVGATRETVTTALLAWRGEGVVAVEGKRVVLLDEARLAERARPPR